jgi:tripartite ATP-independent transporter DctP family solute receptor
MMTTTHFGLKSAVLGGVAAAALMATGATAPAMAQITLIGASQFNEEHAFTKTMRKFEELVQACYTEGEVNFELHLNSELGLERDYANYMNQGLSVDYAVVSPAHLSSFSQMAPLMDMPFLFRDEDHWRKVLEQDGLKPVADDILQRADIRLLGYAGGGTRNVFTNEPFTNREELQGMSLRMQGAPIWTSVFNALGAAPTVIAYDEVYNAIQTGVIQGAENEAAGIEQMRFFEVAPHLTLTQHAITVRPLFMSNKTYQRLPEGLQNCIDSAGAEAGWYGAEIESGEDAQKLQAMIDNGWIQTYDFADRDWMLETANPVLMQYAENLGAADVLEAIQAIE